MISIALFSIAFIIAVLAGLNMTTGRYAEFQSIPGKMFAWLFCVPFMTAIGGILSTLMLILVGFIWWVPFDYHPSETRDLQAIKMNDNLRGSFFLGTGSIDGNPSYIFYYKTGGGYRTDKVQADNVLIIEDNTTPRIVKITESLPSWLVFGPLKDWDHSYEIHVPSGSVKPMINMNLPGSN